MTCPTEFDEADQVLCCGLPTDTSGQYCCNEAGLEAYEKNAKPTITPETTDPSPLDVILLYIKNK